MNLFLANILLALLWVSLSGVFSPANLLFGFLIGYLALFVSRRAFAPSNYFGVVERLVRFIFFFAYELFLANLRVAYEVLTPRHNMHSRVIALPLRARTDFEITALAILISLTPGTLSLDVSADKRVLFIHAMFAEDEEEVRKDIQNNLEARLLAIWRQQPSQ
ncbi:MAG: Na+/H+ antiporter subunit E [Anaerolineae bacterium]|jgi:multicomponent Na+:H+ antiporter subunit E|nr:MAG: Na+/H+ antiporter subunit E [Anaerolineae bacterium]